MLAPIQARLFITKALMKSVFSYLDYRRFLSDFYQEKKRKVDYSYRLFSEKAGLNSPNYLALVIDGKRDLTIANIHQFAAALDLRRDEAEFFETLVLLNQSSTEEEKHFYDDRRRRLSQNKPRNSSKSLPGASLHEWFYTAVLVLAHNQNKEEAAQKIRIETGLKSSDIQKTLEELVSLGFLSETEDKTLKISSSQITFNDPRGLSLAQEKHLRAQLGQSLKAFSQTYKNKTGKFISHTLTIPPGAIEQIHHKLISFVEELTEEMDRQTDTANAQLAQINIQIFKPKSWD